MLTCQKFLIGNLPNFSSAKHLCYTSIIYSAIQIFYVKFFTIFIKIAKLQNFFPSKMLTQL